MPADPSGAAPAAEDTDAPAGARPVQHDSDADRLRFILDAQEHCDHFLTPLADPRGKSVLVAGSGAGTEMLWCLRHGAREVVGVDLVEQRPAALEAALAKLGIAAVGRWRIERLGIEEAGRLGRRFDLVLSNNVFEHLPGLDRAVEVCAELVEPKGRIAVFTDPLFYSSAGSHLPTEPWAHLWEDPTALRDRLLPELPPQHALHELDLPTYLEREISLNRMRLGELLEAIRKAGLVILNLRLLRDRRLGDLASYRERLAAVARERGLAAADFGIEGIGVELVRLDAPASATELRSTEERVREAHQMELEQLANDLSTALASERDTATRLANELGAERRDSERLRTALASEERARRYHEGAARGLQDTLRQVEASRSFRLGRALTAPLRWLRDRRRS